jgi:hypothetical protein
MCYDLGANIVVGTTTPEEGRKSMAVMKLFNKRQEKEPNRRIGGRRNRAGQCASLYLDGNMTRCYMGKAFVSDFT